VLPRAQAKEFSDARQHDDKEKSVKTFCWYLLPQQKKFAQQ